MIRCITIYSSIIIWSLIMTLLLYQFESHAIFLFDYDFVLANLNCKEIYIMNKSIAIFDNHIQSIYWWKLMNKYYYYFWIGRYAVVTEIPIASSWWTAVQIPFIIGKAFAANSMANDQNVVYHYIVVDHSIHRYQFYVPGKHSHSFR